MRRCLRKRPGKTPTNTEHKTEKGLGGGHPSRTPPTSILMGKGLTLSSWENRSAASKSSKPKRKPNKRSPHPGTPSVSRAEPWNRIGFEARRNLQRLVSDSEDPSSLKETPVRDFDIRTLSPALRLVKTSVISKELGLHERAAETLLKVLGVPTLDFGHGPEFSAFSLDLALFGLLLPGNRPIALSEHTANDSDRLQSLWAEQIGDPVLVSVLMCVASLYYQEAVVRTLRDRLRKVTGVVLRSTIPSSRENSPVRPLHDRTYRESKWVRVATDVWDRILSMPGMLDWIRTVRRDKEVTDARRSGYRGPSAASKEDWKSHGS